MQSARPQFLNPGDRIEILPETIIVGTTPDIEPPSFGIIFEDEDLIVVDKPAGIVVHPGAGRPSNTLIDILISTRPEMKGVGEQGRWGVVHRLDRDTSGVMVVAKTASAMRSFQLNSRPIQFTGYIWL